MVGDAIYGQSQEAHQNQRAQQEVLESAEGHRVVTSLHRHESFEQQGLPSASCMHSVILPSWLAQPQALDCSQQECGTKAGVEAQPASTIEVRRIEAIFLMGIKGSYPPLQQYYNAETGCEG